MNTVNLIIEKAYRVDITTALLAVRMFLLLVQAFAWFGVEKMLCAMSSNWKRVIDNAGGLVPVELVNELDSVHVKLFGERSNQW
jgi:hypothetical protein